jgi:hypothetical protein
LTDLEREKVILSEEKYINQTETDSVDTTISTKT